MKFLKHKNFKFNFKFYAISLIIIAVCAYFIYKHYKPTESYVDTITLKSVQEHFDGIGKVFSQHDNPSPTCEASKGCFPGSYVR